MLTIAQITDLHLGKPGEEYMGLDLRERFLRVLAGARSLQPDLYFFTGDFSLRDPDLAATTWFREQAQQLDAPYHVLAGNHDNRAMLREVFGLPGAKNDSIDYVVRAEPRDLIVLDSSQGELEPGQIAWLQTQLGSTRLPAIFMHHPPIPMGMPFMDNKHGLRHYQPLVDLLTSYNDHIPIFCGHYHAELGVQLNNLKIFVAPPTSFFINPKAEEFEHDLHDPAFQLIEMDEEALKVTRVYCQA